MKVYKACFYVSSRLHTHVDIGIFTSFEKAEAAVELLFEGTIGTWEETHDLWQDRFFYTEHGSIGEYQLFYNDKFHDAYAVEICGLDLDAVQSACPTDIRRVKPRTVIPT